MTVAHKLPEPGYYRSGDKDVLVIDSMKLADTENGVVTKDGDDARWQEAVAFRLAFQPSRLFVLSADVFDGRFKPTTREEALKRVQEREAEESKAAAEADAAAKAEEEEA